MSLLLLTPGSQSSSVPCPYRTPTAAPMRGADGVCLHEALLPVCRAGDAAGPAVSSFLVWELDAFLRATPLGLCGVTRHGDREFLSGFSGPRMGE